MKKMKIVVSGIIVIGVLALLGIAARYHDGEAGEPNRLGVLNLPASPADARIQAAEAMIKQSPDKPDGHNLLASALMQKARETGEFAINARANDEISRALQIEPDNYDALKLKGKILLTYHRFREGLDVARRAQAMRPMDHDIYGLLTDALVELGEYPAAIEAAQKMVDLRPDSSSYARVAYLRSLHGDPEGAIAAMQVAVKSSSPRDPEGMAWARVHLGLELVNAGQWTEAEREFDKALLILPGYKLALGQKARSRIAAGDLNSALQIYETEQQESPSADFAVALGDLYGRLGRLDEAEKQYRMFESLEPQNVIVESSWHHMVNYWLDHDRNLSDALDHARAEYESRKDIFTCDTFAWALYKNGQAAEAERIMAEAMRTGSRDPRLLHHSEVIGKAIGEFGPEALR